MSVRWKRFRPAKRHGNQAEKTTTWIGIKSATYKVQLSPHAAKGYKKLDTAIQADVRGGLDVLQRHPLVGPKIKRLKGRLGAYYRYRVGDYRIVYVIGQQEQVVYVDYIQHRKDAYRSR